jgi:hypothetical protein
VAAREPLLADSGRVIVSPIGIVVIDSVVEDPESGETYAPGDTLFLYDYIGEGFRNVRVGEVERQVFEFWEVPGQGARLVREPVQTWWVHVVATQRGVTGWILMRSGIYAHGSDACG